MKTLLIMRHAKSSWKHTELEDHDRPLNKRGTKDSARMAKLIRDKELVPQRILCSSAARARLTATALIEKTEFHGTIEYLDALYMAEAPVCLEVLRSLPDDLERVMLVGHNPGLEGLLQVLSGRIESLPTAALAYLTVPIKSWQDLSTDTQGELIEFWRPRDLK